MGRDNDEMKLSARWTAGRPPGEGRAHLAESRLDKPQLISEAFGGQNEALIRIAALYDIHANVPALEAVSKTFAMRELIRSWWAETSCLAPCRATHWRSY